jgi:hypothetical protein
MVRDYLYCRHCLEDAGTGEWPDIGDIRSRIHVQARATMDAASLMKQGTWVPVLPDEPSFQKKCCCGHDFSAHCSGPTDTEKERLNPYHLMDHASFYKGGQMKKSRIMFGKLMMPYNFLDQILFGIVKT